MDTEFTAIICRLIAEQGRDILFSVQKCKAFLADYTHGEYKKESRLLLQAIEAGVTKELVTTKDLAICKQKFIQNLQDDFFITEEAAVNMVNLLAFALRGDRAKVLVPEVTPKDYQTTQNKRYPILKSASAYSVLEVDEVNRIRERWTCGRCNTRNDFGLSLCKKCGKDFNPPTGEK